MRTRCGRHRCAPASDRERPDPRQGRRAAWSGRGRSFQTIATAPPQGSPNAGFSSDWSPYLQFTRLPVVSPRLYQPRRNRLLGGGTGRGVTQRDSVLVAPPSPTHESELRSSRPRKGGGSRKTARCTVSGTREHGRHRPHLNFNPTTCTSPSDICLYPSSLAVCATRIL